MRREKVVKWLLEKLLGSLFVATVIVWGPIMGLTQAELGFQTVYTIVALCTSLASLIVYVLVPTYMEKTGERVEVAIKKELGPEDIPWYERVEKS